MSAFLNLATLMGLVYFTRPSADGADLIVYRHDPEVDIWIPWEPLDNIHEDYEVLEWARENLCLGHLARIALELKNPVQYRVGDYTRAVLSLIGRAN